jgi:Calcineurin-like phosphoesterase
VAFLIKTPTIPMKNLKSKSLIGIALLCVFSFSVKATSDTLIKANTAWKYLDNGTNQGTAWVANGFNDATWQQGNAELGYGDADEATVLGYGGNAAQKYITTYFRKSFTVANPAIYQALYFELVRDDGAVVYLNGVEIHRSNMPSGTVSFNTLASVGIGGTDESTWNGVEINPAQLLAGTNVISVEIHQFDPTSSDISFNFRLIANTAVLLARQPYLQSVTQNSIIVRWRTNIPTNSKVSYGTSLTYGNTVTDNNLVIEHEIKLLSLQNSTKYFYKIGSTITDFQGDINNYFSTSKPPNTPQNNFRVWVTGDFGVGNSNQIAVKNAYKTYVGANPANFWIWLGDNAYSTGSDIEYTANTFNQYPDIFKNTPVYPSIGNHDYGNLAYQSVATLGTSFPYFNQFSMPTNAEAGGVASGTEKYYSYNYGDAHFIVLDSYGSLNTNTSPMYLWLQNDLNQNLQKFTICYFHHPPYTKGTHNSDTEIESINMRQNIIPLLESKSVDLVLSGHSHVYERTFLMNGHYGLANTFANAMKVNLSAGNVSPFYTKNPVINSTVYAVCGNSGQGGAVGTTTSWPHQAMVSSNRTLFGSMILDIQKDTLSAKFLTSTGLVFDSFKIVKNARCLNTSIAESNVTTGLWQQSTSWICGVVPTALSQVFILPNHIITIPSNTTGEAKKIFMNGQLINQGLLKLGY